MYAVRGATKSDDPSFTMGGLDTTDPLVLRVLEKMLSGFTGMCNADYKFSPDDGTVRFFEVNPRWGGSLFLPFAHDALREAVMVLGSIFGV